MTTLTPRIYQTQAVQALWDFFTNNKEGHPVIALPTGTGKALTLCLFLQSAFKAFAQQKAFCVTHSKELIGQNYEEFMQLWPTAPAGIYSAGLKRKDVHNNIIFAGIASINKNIHAFGKIDLFLIDECHLLSQEEETMYQLVIAVLLSINPNMKVIGFTATPWRQGQGKLTDDGIFTHLVYDGTSIEAFQWFIDQGYLAPLIPKRTETVLDISNVKMLGDDLNQKQLQLAVNKDEITYAALQETLIQGADRHCWLVFGSGVQHVHKITEMLNYMGVSARCVHSNTKEYKMSNEERDANILDWKHGKYTAIVNNGVLTTGLNHKPVDLIVGLRPTHSTVLHVQMNGRGTRPYDYLTEEKEYLRLAFPYTKINCLVLDFGGNTLRLGPINDPLIPRKRGEKTGEIPIKLCVCGIYNHISARFCGGKPEVTAEGCGLPFEFKTLLKTSACSTELIKVKEPDEIILKDFKVKRVTFDLHKKMGKPDGVKVTYYTELAKYNEYILIEHGGAAQRKAGAWWRLRSEEDIPSNTIGILAKCDRLATPTHIRVWVNKEYPEIRAVTFNGLFPS